MAEGKVRLLEHCTRNYAGGCDHEMVVIMADGHLVYEQSNPTLYNELYPVGTVPETDCADVNQFDYARFTIWGYDEKGTRVVYDIMEMKPRWHTKDPIGNMFRYIIRLAQRNLVAGRFLEVEFKKNMVIIGR